jgi:hypothetical protein
MSLEIAAMRWLWLEQKCLVVLEKRTPKYGMGEPDVLGVTPGRYLTEIEIKRSRSDFRRDFEKTHRIIRMPLNPKTNQPWGHEAQLTSHPRQFYYMMPRKLAESLSPEIPDWAGLMTLNECGPWAELMKVAPVNKDSTKLNLRQCARLARQMTNHMMTYAVSSDSHLASYHYRCDHDPFEWVEADVGVYQI